jgi:hypothetical protein
LAVHLNHTPNKYETNLSYITALREICMYLPKKKELVWSLALQKLKLALIGLWKNHKISLHSIPTE